MHTRVHIMACLAQDKIACMTKVLALVWGAWLRFAALLLPPCPSRRWGTPSVFRCLHASCLVSCRGHRRCVVSGGVRSKTRRRDASRLRCPMVAPVDAEAAAIAAADAAEAERLRAKKEAGARRASPAGARFLMHRPDLERRCPAFGGVVARRSHMSLHSRCAPLH